MSLDFNLKKIKNYEELCWEEITNEFGEKQKRINPVTEVIIFRTMAVGMGEITEANWEEFYRRVVFWEHLFGASVVVPDGEGGFMDHYLTPKDIYDHIGLSTNVFPKVSKTKFLSNCYEAVDRDTWRVVDTFKKGLKSNVS